MITLQEVQNSLYKQLLNSEWFNDVDQKCPIDILHATIGLNEEAGEVAGLAKKQYCRNREIDDDRWVGELGDVLWYLVAVATLKGISLEQVWEHNCEKLEERRKAGMKGDTVWRG